MSDASTPAVQPGRRVETWVYVGIFFLAPVFVWFLLRNGYSTKVRAIGFGWTTLLVVSGIVNNFPADAPPAVAVQATTASTSQPGSKFGTKERYRTTAIQLYNDYHDNETATDQRINGMPVVVSGTIASIEWDFQDSFLVRLATPNHLLNANMKMEDSEEPAAHKLSKGMPIDITCKTVMRLVGSPYGDHCVFGNQ